MSPGLADVPAAAEILTVGGRAYAFGLRWTSVAARASLRAEALSAARTEGANFVALDRTFGQFGLARIPGAPDGPLSIAYRPRVGAAAIAAAVGTATLAAFPFEDGRWLVLAIDRKGFLPDGDMIVADAGQARIRIEGLIAQSPTSWRRKFLPAEWKIPDARSVSPQDLLGRSHTPHLTSVWMLQRRRHLCFALGGMAVLAAAGVVFGLRTLTAAPPVTEVPVQPPKPVAAIWTPAGLTIDRCLSAFRDAQRYMAVPGWVLDKYTCQGSGGISLSFARTGDGQISAIRNLVPAAQLSDDGRSAVLALPLPPLPRISATAGFVTRQRYQLVGIDLAQRLGGAFTLQAPRRPLPGEAAGAAPNQSWALFSWTYQTEAPAIVWARPIARLGSISVDTLTFSPSDNLWQLSGDLYAGN